MRTQTLQPQSCKVCKYYHLSRHIRRSWNDLHCPLSVPWRINVTLFSEASQVASLEKILCNGGCCVCSVSGDNLLSNVLHTCCGGFVDKEAPRVVTSASYVRRHRLDAPLRRARNSAPPGWALGSETLQTSFWVFGKKKKKSIAFHQLVLFGNEFFELCHIGWRGVTCVYRKRKINEERIIYLLKD